MGHIPEIATAKVMIPRFAIYNALQSISLEDSGQFIIQKFSNQRHSLGGADKTLHVCWDEVENRYIKSQIVVPTKENDICLMDKSITSNKIAELYTESLVT